MPRSPSALLLKQLMLPYRRRLRLPLCLAVLALVCLLLQSYVLAVIFSDWLHAVASGKALSPHKFHTLLPYLALCLLARPVFTLLKERQLQALSLDIRHRLRAQLLDNLATLGNERHAIGSDGALAVQVLEQVDALDGYISRFYVQSLIAVITPLAIAAVVFTQSALAGGLLLATMPLVPVFMILVGKLAAQKSREQLDILAQLGGRFLDILRGLPTLRRLNALDWAERQVSAAAGDYQTSTMGVLKLAFLSTAVLEFFAALAIAMVAVYLGLGLLGLLPWAKGEVPVGYQSALFILLLAPEFYQPLRQLGSDYHAKAQAEAAVEALQPLLNVVPAPTAPSALSLATAPRLHFADFAITHHARKRLAPLSADIPAAKRFGIVGASGSGKSSLLQALLGFVPFEGGLRLNQQAVQTADLLALRSQCAYLAQTPSLMPLTIADNLRLANAAASDADLQSALVQVGLWELVAALPLGLNTILGERGQGLSGGQQQRLSLAQLLLRDAPLWLLDEPCAHLDEQSALDIYALIERLSVGKTLLLVGHDIAALDWLDGVIHLAPQTEEHHVTAR